MPVTRHFIAGILLATLVGFGHATVAVAQDASVPLIESSIVLEASDGAAYDALGTAVVLQDESLFVGCRGADAIATNAGAIYLFEPDAVTGDWTQVQKLTSSDSLAFDETGDRGEQRDHHQDGHRQNQLVRGAEQLYRPLLDRAWRQLDERRSDRGTHIGLGAERGTEQLRDTDGDSCCGDAARRARAVFAHVAKLPPGRTRKPYRTMSSARLLYSSTTVWKVQISPGTVLGESRKGS